MQTDTIVNSKTRLQLLDVTQGRSLEIDTSQKKLHVLAMRHATDNRPPAQVSVDLTPTQARRLRRRIDRFLKGYMDGAQSVAS